jgi:hypothetical protein
MLSPDEQAALERAELVLPHDQMVYLAALSRGLDGKRLPSCARSHWLPAAISSSTPCA